MRDNFTGKMAEKADPALNDLVGKIRRAVDMDGVDAFTRFKQGALSKSQLCEAIARQLA